jgi:hypothetical protein
VARALIVPWRGRIYLLGLQGDDQVRPVFLPQAEMPFWKRAIGFTTHAAPDFPREPALPAARGGEVCFLLLAHQPPAEVERMLARWRGYRGANSPLLLAYGGTRAGFEQVAHEPKLFVDDPRLRTRDHQREKQSYTRVFQQAARWLEDHVECGYVYLAEYDHWPLAPDLTARLVERLRGEKADVLGHQVARRDGTSCVYFQGHVSDPRFGPWLRNISRREDRDVVLNMLGTGSFWTREAFLAVAREKEDVPVYLEMYLPTLAHHLGFRVRDFGDQSRYVDTEGDRGGEIAEARAAGAWTIHPVKSWPDET